MLKKFGKMWGNVYYQGGIILTISSLIVNFLSYLFYLITGRVLGPAGYGEIVTLFSYITILSVPISVVSVLVTQKIGSKDDQRFMFAKELELWIIDRIKRWWFLGIPALAVIPLLPRLTNLSTQTAYILIPLVLLSFGVTFYYACLQGLRFFAAVSIIGVITVFIRLLGPILGLSSIHALTIVLVFIFIAYVFNFLANRNAFKKAVAVYTLTKPKVERSFRTSLGKSKSIIAIMSVLGLVLLNNIDVVFVKKYFSAEEAGIYGAWSLLAKVIFYFMGPAISMTLVYFSSKKNLHVQHKVYFIAMTLFALVGIVSYIAYTFFAPAIIGLLFGAKFAGVIPYLSQASIVGSLFTVITFSNNYLLAKESKLNLILPVGVLTYMYILFHTTTELINIVNLNVIFAVSLATIYFIASIWVMVYNRQNGNEK